MRLALNNYVHLNCLLFLPLIKIIIIIVIIYTVKCKYSHVCVCTTGWATVGRSIFWGTFDCAMCIQVKLNQFHVAMYTLNRIVKKIRTFIQTMG